MRAQDWYTIGGMICLSQVGRDAALLAATLLFMGSIAWFVAEVTKK